MQDTSMHSAPFIRRRIRATKAELASRRQCHSLPRVPHCALALRLAPAPDTLRVSGAVFNLILGQPRNAKCPISHLRNAKCLISHLRNAKCLISHMRNVQACSCEWNACDLSTHLLSVFIIGRLDDTRYVHFQRSRHAQRPGFRCMPQLAFVVKR